MNDYEKLEAVHCAIQEALNGNSIELEQALILVEKLREPHLKENTLMEKINNDIEGELSAYSEYKDDIGDVDSFDDGILEGRKEFAEELWNLINKEERR